MAVVIGTRDGVYRTTIVLVEDADQILDSDNRDSTLIVDCS
jgi:hypothetical protein